MGNICRSPTAEAVARKRLQDAGLEVLVESAGTIGYHAGESPDLRARQAGEARGYDFSGILARQVASEDFVHFDLILAMDRRNFSDLTSRCPERHKHKIKLLLSYAPKLGVDEVPDPYYGGAQGFEQVLDLVESATDGLLASLKTHV
ncbi:low molecular weight phosphotyrosine protein phosphatase [Gallaecimonas kandeliae]|uniref:low molecular weight protein-tyrosine-phosphatase n=1 Tax=Gallaecimonas kandeliae TaxID=3029055 RepID=UPI002648A212|nr:low molecular weight protein-tyrosine-phosphatase [Gallaecimonas kandeliae]WKE67400.1 low molecular weight phosphotyrosine protein phosphatase [Gallaecimonas kandeliae]